MAQHEFGIMEQAPAHGERYDRYEPWKYECVSVHDDFIEPLLLELKKIDFFWHSIDIEEKGLAYWGITLIPPESMNEMIQVIDGISELYTLKEMLLRAKKKGQYVIHFGI